MPNQMVQLTNPQKLALLLQSMDANQVLPSPGAAPQAQSQGGGLGAMMPMLASKFGAPQGGQVGVQGGYNAVPFNGNS